MDKRRFVDKEGSSGKEGPTYGALHVSSYGGEVEGRKLMLVIL